MTTIKNQALGSDDSFDIFLQNQLQNEKQYLPDNFFTARVVAALPPVKKPIYWQEIFIMAVPLLIISVLVLTQHSLLAFIVKAWVLVSVASVSDLLSVLLQVSIAALLVGGYWFVRRYRML